MTGCCGEPWGRPMSSIRRPSVEIIMMIINYSKLKKRTQNQGYINFLNNFIIWIDDFDVAF